MAVIDVYNAKIERFSILPKVGGFFRDVSNKRAGLSPLLFINEGFRYSTKSQYLSSRDPQNLYVRFKIKTPKYEGKARD